MPRIYRHDDVAPRLVSLGSRLDRMQAAAALQVDDQAIAVFVVGACREAARANGLVQIENDAQLAIGAHRAANRAHGPYPLGHRAERVREAARFQVYDEAIRPAQGEDVV